MGGGDLNMKKSWHPLLIKNQERVWKEEQKAQEEQKKLTQLMKEKEEERQLQELRKLQESAGGKKGPERLDWMYAAGPNQSSSAKAQELEDFLLGKKSVDKLIDNGTALSKLSSDSKDVFISTMNPNANTYRDTQAKIREDPLLLIKKTEQANIKAIVTNPLKMKELKEKTKKSKKDKKDKTKNHNTGSKSSSKKHEKFSDIEDDLNDKYSHSKRRYRSRSRSISPPRKRYRSRSRSISPPRKRDRRSSPTRRNYHERNDHRQDKSDDKSRRMQKLQQMMDDAKKLTEERRKRVDDTNRKEKEEEIKVTENKKRTFENGVHSEYLKNAYKDAYSSHSNFDLGERVRRHRGTLQKAAE
ncbi:7334_t:CDS:2 [Cetraspora pellucida]|uniref:7334_t:CDS:1 n=1 Tax=Cetraspora pellucida TaxID=1433469 RepID=A0ACA9NZ29_9GLOM|nr:7334_t:CDS:2 [Cetraspora pellucida]